MKDKMIEFPSAIEALRYGHQVYRRAWVGSERFLVATQQGPFLVFDLSHDVCGLWFPTNTEVMADDYLLINQRLRTKAMPNHYEIGGAIKMMMLGHVMSRDDDKALYSIKNGKLLWERGGGVQDPYDLCPEDFVCTSWKIAGINTDALRADKPNEASAKREAAHG